MGMLALVMIVRNEARSIERCLNSVAPYVDRMVVLDTGSQDDTVDRARLCGAEVFETVWPKCFATARNQALSLADADWNLILDGDEWIASGGDALRGITEDLSGPGVVRVDSLGGGASDAVTSDWITRLLPRYVRYAGQVHEQPVDNRPRVRIPVVIGHDGYQTEALRAKQGRNQQLLQLALQKAGGSDPYLMFQMGKDYETYGSLAQASEHYEAAFKLCSSEVCFWPQLVVRAMHCLGKSGQLASALALASECMPRLNASVNYQFTLGDLCLDAAVADPAEAVAHWLPLAEAAWLRCLSLGERPDQDGYVRGRGSYLSAHNLSVIYDGLGDGAQSLAYRQLSESLRSVRTTGGC